MRPLGPPCMAPARLGHALRGGHSCFPGGSSAQQLPAGKAMLGGMGDSQALHPPPQVSSVCLSPRSSCCLWVSANRCVGQRSVRVTWEGLFFFFHSFLGPP